MGIALYTAGVGTPSAPFQYGETEMSDKILTPANTLFIGMEINDENGESQHVEISPHDVVDCVDGIQSGYGRL